ncbi:MAG: hypothetical protein ABI480_09965 [Chitinophagaceae bacterium]
MISTSDYSLLPSLQQLQQACKAISVLDAIMSQEWQYRYYSYNSKWSDGEECFEMRNGGGDHMLILFRKDGCVINGMAHEYFPKDKSELTKGLPGIYDEFISGEPVSSLGTTFCLWTATEATWTVGEITDHEDGSEYLLAIFDGNPQTYMDWATEYYEIDFPNQNDSLKVITDIYKGTTLTKNMVLSLVDKLEDWEKLTQDLQDIDYPHDFA